MAPNSRLVIVLLVVFLADGASGACPSGLRRFRNSCYRLVSKISSYNAAENFCAEAKGKLAAPIDRETEGFLEDTIRQTGSVSNYWVGVKEVHGRWVFSDGSPVRSYNHWASHEPSGPANEDCVLLGARANLRWVTTACHWGYRFICQYDGCDLDALQNIKPIKRNTLHFSKQDGLFMDNDFVEVECMPGFSPSGFVNVSCQTGQWDPDKPCSPGCRLPTLKPPLEFMFEAPSIVGEGKKIMLTCKQGWTLQGENPIICQGNGNWSSPLPVCVPAVAEVEGRCSGAFTSVGPGNLTFSRSLKHWEEPELFAVDEGTPFFLDCLRDRGLRKDPPRDWTWMKEQYEIKVDDWAGPAEIAALPNATLRIRHMGSKAEGLYTCVADIDGIGRMAVRSAHVHLKRKCNLKLEIIPEDQTIPEGEYVLLRCYLPGATISWYKKDRLLGVGGPGSPGGFADDDSNRIYVLPNGILLVQSATYNDTGTYRCIAEDTETKCRVEHAVALEVEASLNDICGTVSASAPRTRENHGKLVGGHEAPNGSHPWVVIFTTEHVRGVEKFLCGGNLINNHWVATAGHCFHWVKTPKDLELLKVKLGKHDRLSRENHEKILEVMEIIIHPSLNMKNYDNDIALVRLSDRVIFSDHIRPICLPSPGFLNKYYPIKFSKSSGTVSGWGKLEEGGIQPRYLHHVKLPLVELPSCKESTSQPVTSNMFCAGYPEAVGDSCQGDSGGPFEMEKDGKTYLAGIVSWGEGCARPGKYGFYTKVENYLEFLNKHMEQSR